MRENRTCGSEGGEAQSLPYPYPVCRVQLGALIFYAAGEISAAYGAISFWTF